MDNLRIAGVNVEQVGVFDNLQLRFKADKPSGKAEIHLFTGENGTGKSTLLQILTYFETILKLRSSRRTTPKPLIRDFLWNKISTHKFFDENEAIKIFWLKEGREFDLKIYGNSDYNKLPNFIEDYYYNIIQGKVNSSFFLFAYSGTREIENGSVEMFKEIDYNPLSDALEFNKPTLNTNLFQWIANVKTRAALSFQKGNKKRSEVYLENLTLIENSLSKIIDRKLEFIIDEEELNVQIKIDTQEIVFQDLADGYKSIITWLVDLIFRLDALGFVLGKPDYEKTFILFLDEIEVHLHPAAQRRILPVIQELFPTAQIFITTHSPFIIGSVDGAWVYKFKLDKSGYSILDGDPFLSEDGQSYRYIMEEVLGVKEEFGIGATEQLSDFYKKRDEILKDPNGHQKEFLQLAKELAVQSEELKSIVGSELRQLSRITKKEFSI